MSTIVEAVLETMDLLLDELGVCRDLVKLGSLGEGVEGLEEKKREV
jgi:hypothetical protein